MLGHATASMTVDLYGHLVDANLWQAAWPVGDISGTFEPPGPSSRHPRAPRVWTRLAGPVSARRTTDSVKTTRYTYMRSQSAGTGSARVLLRLVGAYRMDYLPSAALVATR